MTKIIVTGGAGFIGSNFIRRALETRPEWKIINLDALTYAGNYNSVSDLDKERHQFIHGDICDPDLVNSIFSENNLSGVIHFAAESHVDRSITDPDAFVKTNVTGTFNLLQNSLAFWKDEKVADNFRFLNVSTDEVYGSLGPTGYFTETTRYDPSSPYSASKAAADHLVRAFHRTYGLPTLITNCSNNYGPYQFPEKLIPLMILNIIEEKPLPVYGDGKNVRDWLYVIDHCDALIRVFEKGLPGETYNVGGNEEKENIEIVHLLCDILDNRLGRVREKSSRSLIKYVTDRPGHDRRYAIDATKIHEKLDWQPAHTFEQALESTVDWYLNNMEWVNSVRSGEYREWINKNYSER